MKPSTYILIIAIGILTTVIWITSRKCMAKDIEETVTKDFTVKRGQLFSLRADLGSVEITSWSQNELKVTVTKRADTNSKNRAKDIFENLELSFDQDDVGVRVVVRYHGPKVWWGDSRRLRLHFEVTVPREFNLDVQTGGGSIQVTDLNGKIELLTSGGPIMAGKINGSVRAKTSGGSIKIEQAQGPVLANTSGGSIAIGKVTGSVEARTSGGSISLEEVTGSAEAHTSGGSLNLKRLSGSATASTSGGGIHAEFVGTIDRDCSLRTSGGSIRVFLPANISIDLDAHTSGGRVESDLPITVQGVIKNNSIKGKINNGGPLMTLRTSGGNISVKALEPK
ncbi:MAG: DUF4097 domain-containing protein [candidate division KSB1 bacterium]|nr:DUF4097 domain-containing protein [candidate division KSB1 bacterium]MDZ7356704.1 DUF4097 domain-containing protein [candidate division KSB1 bacterium]MDZ7398614.1 DUF4097 domain-containing protein [candidate division KSB1 bacterium]